MKGQRQAILKHLQTQGSITSMEAFQKYGATRLSAIIFNFRKMGYDIDTHIIVGKNRYGSTCQYAEYRLEDNNGNKDV